MDVHALVLEVDLVDEDAVLGLVAAPSLGAEVVGGPSPRSVVRAYFATVEEADAARDRIDAAGLDVAAMRPRVEPVRDGGWVERYQAGLRPFDLGRRFWIDPTGNAGSAPPGRIAVRLAPGRAFGTGEHATTRLCASVLEDRVRPSDRWLDLGCGTGILAIVASRAGAREVRAVDSDPEAVLVAREVLRANGLGAGIEVLEADVRNQGPEWDGVVANLDRATLLGNAAAISGLVAPGGVLVASGFLEPDASEIADAIASCGLEPEEIRTEGEWAAIVWERR